MQSVWFSIPQLAKELGISRIAVYRKVKDGRIPAVRIGRNYAISVNTAQALIKERNAKNSREWLDHAVKRVVAEYGVVLQWLSRQ